MLKNLVQVFGMDLSGLLAVSSAMGPSSATLAMPDPVCPGFTILLPSPPACLPLEKSPAFAASLQSCTGDDFETSLLNVKALSPAELVTW